MIYGKDIIISEGSPAVPIAAAKSCSIVRQSDTVEISDPTMGRAKTYLAGRTGWQVVVNSLLLAMKSNLMRVGNTYTITMSIAGSNTDKLTGTAICTECQITGTVGNLAQGSFRFLGSGSLS